MGLLFVSPAVSVAFMPLCHYALLPLNHIDNLMVKEFSRMYVVRGSACSMDSPDIDPARVIPVYQNRHIVVYSLPFQTHGDMGSVLGLVGPESVYCDWARLRV